MKAVARISSLTLLALGTVITAGPNMVWGAGQEWVLADQNPDSSFYYNKPAITKPRAGLIEVTTRVVYTEKGKAQTLELLKPVKGYETLSETRFLIDINCRERKSNLLRVTHYDETGNQLKSFDLAGKTAWEEIPPDARLELIAESECAP